MLNVVIFGFCLVAGETFSQTNHSNKDLECKQMGSRVVSILDCISGSETCIDGEATAGKRLPEEQLGEWVFNHPVSLFTGTSYSDRKSVV